MQSDDQRRETYRRMKAMALAYRTGDLAGVKAALGWPEGFPNSPQPFEFASGDWPLVTAINLSPLRFVRRLLDLGADPNYEALDGFPSLFVALDADRPDRLELIALLLQHGARTDMRGVNDWTPLHYAVARRNLAAVRLLLERGADPQARTRIDDCATALDDAVNAGFTEAAEAIRARS